MGRSASARTRLIVDTDIGSDVDDALALLALLHTPGADIVGVTTVYACAELRAKIARAILDAAGRRVPVFAGHDQPLKSVGPIWLAGTEGLDVLNEAEINAPLDWFDCGKDAVRFIIETVMQNPGEVTILALGALTNLAKAIEQQPEIVDAVKAIYFMGAGITFRNRRMPPTVFQEGSKYKARDSHNVCCDLKAARIVFESPARIHVITNDVTQQVWVDTPVAKRLMETEDPPESALVGGMLKVWLDRRTERRGRPVTGTCPHDVLAAAEACNLGYVSYQPGVMSIMCNGSTKFIADSSGRHLAGAAVDVGRFHEWLADVLFTPA